MKILIVISWSLLITSIILFMRNNPAVDPSDPSLRKLINFANMEEFRTLFLSQCPNTLTNLNQMKSSK
jgi:hypothetical protein